MKPDPGLVETENFFEKEVKKRIDEEYYQAVREVKDKLDDYFRRFEIKNKTWKRWVEQGIKTPDEYYYWLEGQIAVGERWEAMKDILAEDLHHVNDIAKNITNGYKPDIYAINFNYGTYDVEHKSGIDTGFTLYDHETVEWLIRDDPDIFPTVTPASLTAAAAKDLAWQKRQIQSAMIQGILQGDGLLELATRLSDKMGETNRKAAIRNARTAYTGVMNAGRIDSFRRAQYMGVDMQQMWTATLDMRTRPGHRELDGVINNVGDVFQNSIGKIRYPGDPQADPENVYNCRCCLRADVAGLQSISRNTRDMRELRGMTYEEWKKSREVRTNPILLPEIKAKAEKEFYLEEYRTLGILPPWKKGKR